MIATWLYRNPRILLLIVAMIVVVGLAGLSVMPRLEDPVLGERVGVVTTAYPGADAEQIESLVTAPIEELLSGIAEIKRVRSNSRTGISNVVIELQDRVVDFDAVWAVVRDQLRLAPAKLPQLVGQNLTPELSVFPLKAYASIIAVRPKQDAAGKLQPRTLARIADGLRARMLEVPGTERVVMFGGGQEVISATLRPEMLASMNLSVAAVAAQVEAALTKNPSGSLPTGESSLLLDIAVDPDPVRQLADAEIRFGSRGEVVAIKDIATIEQGFAQPLTELALIDGRPAIVLAAMVDDSLRIDRWDRQLTDVLTSFQTYYEHDVAVESIFSQANQVHTRMLGLLRSLGIGTAAVVLVVLLLMGWRSMIVVATALPLSALMVIAGMRWLEIPIHQMSVTGLIVALGLLIDNAIVVVEEVRQNSRAGLPAVDAIRKAVGHLAVPLLGSTLTTALAFLPIATLPGPSGEFVGTIAVSVILAIVGSFVLAMTVIPALIGWLQPSADADNLDGVQQPHAWADGVSNALLGRLYESSLRLVFSASMLSIPVAVILVVVGLSTAFRLPMQFFPATDRQQIQIEIERSANATVPEVQQTVNQVRRLVAQHPQVARQHWFIGRSAPTFYYNVVPRRRGTPFCAQSMTDLQPTADPQTVVRQLQTTIDDQVLDSRIIVRQLEQGPPFDAPVEVRLIGPDLPTLQRLGSELRLLLSQTSQVIHTRSDLEDTVPKIALSLDSVAAGQASLSQSQIGSLLYTTLAGADAGNVQDGGRSIPVRVKMEFGETPATQLLGALPLPSRLPRANSARGDTSAGPPTSLAASSVTPPSLTLSHVAQLDLRSDVGGIIRIDGQRVNEVKAYLTAGVLPSTVIDEFKSRLQRSTFTLPAGYKMEFGGESEQRSQAVNRLIANSVSLFALMLLTLVASFGSFRCALIVAMVGGLSICFATLALWIFGYPFGFMAIVGTMGLVGVAINDSIVVIAAIRANPRARGGDLDAIIDAVSGCTRHIVATTLTTMVGFAPLVIFAGRFWPPVAITIAGGVAGATFLALYFSPSLYRLLHRSKEPMLNAEP